MKLLSFGQTDKGLKRSNNEDSFCAAEDLRLFAVADGIGGQSAGEIASRMAVDVIRDFMSKPDPEELIGTYRSDLSPETNQLADAIRLANQVIYESALSNPSWRDMGTTIASVFFSDDKLSVGHVGDSRVYLIRGESIVQLTEDHSLVAEQVRMGLLTREEGEASKMRNVITRALGKNPRVDPDLSEVPVIPGDRILLCSDGLSTMVPDETILQTVNSFGKPEPVCKALVDLANKNGGRDNITVVVVFAFENTFNYYLSKIF